MEVTGAAQIGMFDDRVLGIARTAFELVGDDGGDALVGQCADRDGAEARDPDLPRTERRTRVS